jgi:hypothetical protein
VVAEAERYRRERIIAGAGPWNHDHSVGLCFTRSLTRFLRALSLVKSSKRHFEPETPGALPMLLTMVVSFVPRSERWIWGIPGKCSDSARRCGFRSSQQKRATDLDSMNAWIPKLDVAARSHELVGIGGDKSPCVEGWGTFTHN